MSLRLSPFHVVSSDTIVLEGLKLMESTKQSYLLLHNSKGSVTGIFTKTDLLELVLNLKDDPKGLERPFHQLMTKPLKTLSLNLLHTAPVFMRKNEIGHLPITHYNSSNKSEEIVGIVSERNILDFVVGLSGLPPIFGGAPIKKSRKTIGVLSPDGVSFHLLEKVFSQSTYVNAERIRYANFNFKEVATEVDALVVDIDGIEKRTWFPVVEAAAKNPNLESVCIVCDHKLYIDVVNLLRPLEALGLFKIYEKPLNVTLLLSDLERFWAR